MSGEGGVTLEEATPEDAVRIAILELEKALARPDHLGVYVHSALIWLRGLDEDADSVSTVSTNELIRGASERS